MLRLRSSKGLNGLLSLLRTQKSGQLEVSLYPSPQETEHSLHLDHCEYWHTWTHNQSWPILETVPACYSTRSSTVFGESGHDTCQCTQIGILQIEPHMILSTFPVYDLSALGISVEFACPQGFVSKSVPEHCRPQQTAQHDCLSLGHLGHLRFLLPCR